MAKTSMKLKQQREQKFSTREYNRCKICGRPHAYLRNTVDIPASNMKKAICQILVDEGYVKSFTVTEDGKQGVITVTLKYVEGGVPAIKGLKRVSKPGLRIYSNAAELPKVMKGLGTAVISTSKGVMTDREARKMNIGGEVLAFIW